MREWTNKSASFASTASGFDLIYLRSSICELAYRFQYVFWQQNSNSWPWITGPCITWLQTLLPFPYYFLTLFPRHVNHLSITPNQYSFPCPRNFANASAIIQPTLSKSIFTFHSSLLAPFYPTVLTLNTNFHNSLLRQPNWKQTLAVILFLGWDSFPRCHNLKLYYC